jgi:hypothetical protein
MAQMVLSTAELCSVGCSESMSTKRTAVSLQTAVGSDEWEKRRSTTHNADYWYNVRTGERAWKDPSTGADEQPGQPTAKKVKIAEAAQTSVDKTIVWKKMFSTTYKRDYWCNDETGERRWDDPNTATAAGVAPDPSAAPRSPVKSSQKKPEFRLTQRVLTDPAEITAELERERQAVAVDAPSCPREVATANLAHIVHRLRTESAAVVHDKSPNAEHPVVFRLADDDTAMITRAVQEDQILKTRLKVQLREGVADLPSFWDVWERDSSFRQAIIGSADPNEAKWKLQTSYNYKLATTFMPPYAKAIYEHFNAKSVLDPCAGWGDRMVGAASSSLVERYVCFDPNTTLRPGYAALMKLFGHEVTELSAQKLQFSNGFAQYALPFEEGALQLPDCSFDLGVHLAALLRLRDVQPAQPAVRRRGQLDRAVLQAALHPGLPAGQAGAPLRHPRGRHLCGQYRHLPEDAGAAGVRPEVGEPAGPARDDVREDQDGVGVQEGCVLVAVVLACSELRVTPVHKTKVPSYRYPLKPSFILLCRT